MSDITFCPFCGSTKLKVDQKTGGNAKWNTEKHKLEKFIVVTVRCNKCHARGPTCSIFAGEYDRPVKELEEKAFELWNKRVNI